MLSVRLLAQTSPVAAFQLQNPQLVDDETGINISWFLTSNLSAALRRQRCWSAAASRTASTATGKNQSAR